MKYCAAPHPEFGYGLTCAYYWHHGQPHHSLTGPDEHWYSTALILHPDPTVRDPYGVITREQIHEYARMAEGFVDGWLTHAVQTDNACENAALPEYWILREYVSGIADVPDYVASQIALHYCRPCAQRPWGHRLQTSFHAVP